MPGCGLLCQYETNKLVRIQSLRLGSLKWTLNASILLFICFMLLWNRNYQQFDLLVSSVTTKVKGVARTHLPGVGDVVWDVVDYSGPSQEKNSFFVATNVIVTKNQKQGRCPEVPLKGGLCRSDADCEEGGRDQQNHGIKTGSCLKFDVLRKTCEVSAWCPVETRTSPPRPALLAAAENFTVLIKNNIRFPAFRFIRRNILPDMNDGYLRSCRRDQDPLCPIFRLGDVVREAGEKFSEMAVEGGVIGILIEWDCNLDRFMQRCLPRYSFRRLDEKESNRTLYPGLNFRFAKYSSVNAVEQRTLYKAFGIRFDVLVFGQAGKFSFIQLVVYVGSTLSYFALTTVMIDWLIGTSCYSAEVGQIYSEKKVESVADKQKCILCVSYVDERRIRLVKRSQKKSLQLVKPTSFQPHKEDGGHLRAAVLLLQPGVAVDPGAPDREPAPNPPPAAWCQCGCCAASSLPQRSCCCRLGAGACVSSSPPFERLVLRRPLLEAVLCTGTLCRRRPRAEARPPPPPCAAAPTVSTSAGGSGSRRRRPPCHPSCCGSRVRYEYPSPDGRYGGFRPARMASMQACANGEL
uniref:P2X purinoceptor n=1 Tax=Cyclopterus lumpus TaxID=8103 RepID=A0A8C2XAJ4_CYCLU